MSSEDARRLLSRLANDATHQEERDAGHTSGTDYVRTIENARSALDDVERAAAFVDDGGLDRLEAAVERAERELSHHAEDGRETLAAYGAYRTAARSDEAAHASQPIDLWNERTSEPPLPPRTQ